MSLKPGTRFGPYEILALLGAGGMGEVYRARDTRLGRDVAIKTLPAAFAQDPERRARFESESKAVAALSHPNVLAIHDVGAEGDTVFAVMELVEGETLRERLVDGALPGSRAVGIAIQVARGLAAAHDRGVVHRDLKPENVMITADGPAKILDFGLAKRTLAEREGLEAPTVAASTEPGAVLGTPAYMSPEQVRGLPADARSDLFALGALLYEMLSGRRAFEAESAADVMSAILREDPADLVARVPDVSPAITRLVSRCLEKDPAARFRSAADVAFALEAIGTASSSPRAGGALEAPPASSAPRFHRLTYRRGAIPSARFVPGSTEVVFSATWQGRPLEIFSARPGSPEARGLGLPPAGLLAVSATGEMAISLGYHNDYWNQVSGSLARVPLSGGGVRSLQKDVGHADWGPDGRTMAVVRYVDSICRLEYPAGRTLLETRNWISDPRVSPDGRRVAFARHMDIGETAGDICTVDEAGALRVLLEGMTSVRGLAWSPAGDEVWCSGISAGQQNGIWAVRPGAPPREIHTFAARVRLFDLAPDGRALISLGTIYLGVNVGAEEGSRETDLSWFDGSVAADFSPDGRQLLMWECHEAENPHYASFLRDLDGSPAVRLGEGIATAISPDGQWALACLFLPRHRIVLYPTGFGEPREVPVRGFEHINWAGFHPDGQNLIVIGRKGDEPRRAYLTSIASGESTMLWDEEVSGRRDGCSISPDGGRLVMRRASGEYVLLSIPERSITELPGLEKNASVIQFDASGRALYYTPPHPAPHAIRRLDLETRETVHWRTLSPPDPAGALYIGGAIVSADGSRYGYTFLRHISDLYVVEGLS